MELNDILKSQHPLSATMGNLLRFTLRDRVSSYEVFFLKLGFTLGALEFTFMHSERVLKYVFSVIAYGPKVLADLFAVRGHALKKWLFFRFA